jgi:hypothetical protein
VRHYPGDGRNLFSLAVSQVQRYEFFLRMILRRYDENCTEFMGAVMAHRAIAAKPETGPYEPSADEAAVLNTIDNLSPYIQLDSESFTSLPKYCSIGSQSCWRTTSGHRPLKKSF